MSDINEYLKNGANIQIQYDETTQMYKASLFNKINEFITSSVSNTNPLNSIFQLTLIVNDLPNE